MKFTGICHSEMHNPRIFTKIMFSPALCRWGGPENVENVLTIMIWSKPLGFAIAKCPTRGFSLKLRIRRPLVDGESQWFSSGYNGEHIFDIFGVSPSTRGRRMRNFNENPRVGHFAIANPNGFDQIIMVNTFSTFSGPPQRQRAGENIILVKIRGLCISLWQIPVNFIWS
jgi:hypothetical protein